MARKISEHRKPNCRFNHSEKVEMQQYITHCHGCLTPFSMAAFIFPDTLTDYAAGQGVRLPFSREEEPLPPSFLDGSRDSLRKKQDLFDQEKQGQTNHFQGLHASPCVNGKLTSLVRRPWV